MKLGKNILSLISILGFWCLLINTSGFSSQISSFSDNDLEELLELEEEISETDKYNDGSKEKKSGSAATISSSLNPIKQNYSLVYNQKVINHVWFYQIPLFILHCSLKIHC